MTILHFSDYHSHAVPFYDGGRMVGGLARTFAYVRREKAKGALVFSGGDMLNSGSPSWSDKYQCAEWSWLNGVVDAMAFGNHDADYGRAAFDRCRASARYPILSANTAGLPRTAVIAAGGARIGVFAVAGPDFGALVKAEGFTFGDRIAAAHDAVRELRDQHVDAVVMIGHEHLDDDYALARAVPGIDVIFGTHSHLRRELTRIDGTDTWFISPYQYLEYVSRVELTIENGRVARVEGRLVPIDESVRPEARIARRVAGMQRALERDPKYAPLFVPIATLQAPLPVDALAAKSVEIMRGAAGADAAISTASSFRQALPPGALTLEALRAALPYDNEIVVVTMTGAQLERLLASSRPEEALVVAKPQTFAADATVRVAVTDYLANVATRYREQFAGAAKTATGLRVRDEVRKALARQ